MSEEVRDLLCRVYTLLTELDAEFDKEQCIRPDVDDCRNCPFSKLAWDVFTIKEDVSTMLAGFLENRQKGGAA